MAESTKKPKPGKETRTRFRDQRFLNRLGTRIKRVRIARGYSIDRLYLETSHLSRATISRIESGRADPQASTLKRIAETLGVSLPHLIDLDGPISPSSD